MSYLDCLACKEAGTTPLEGARGRVIFDPAITMSGTPTIEGHRLSAELMARRVYHQGLKEQMRLYQLTREELLVACWWAGSYGPKTLKKALGAWAQIADLHLWYRCIQIPDPPMKEAK